MSTKFYLDRDLSDVQGTLPSTTATASAQAVTYTPGATNGTAATPLMYNRTLRPDVLQTAFNQTNIQYASAAVTTNQKQPLLRFVSPPLAAQTIASQTITVQLGFSNSSTASAFAWTWMLTVYRPGTGATVGQIFDGITRAISSAAATTSEANSSTNSAGSSTSVTLQAGDVLVLEIWRNAAVQSMGTSYTNTVYYDGLTEGSASNNAAFLQFTNDVPLQTLAPEITLRSVAGNSGTSGPVTVTLPAGTTNGDFLVIWCECSPNPTGGNPMTAPTGWTKSANFSASGTGNWGCFFWAQYSASLSMAFTYNSNTSYCIGAYYKTGATLDVDGSPVVAYNNTSNTTLNTGQPVTTGAGEYEIVAYEMPVGASAMNTSVNIDAQATSGIPSSTSWLCHYLVHPLGSGVTCPAFTWTLSTSIGSKTGVGLLLKAVAPGAVALTGSAVAQATSNNLGLRFKGTRPTDAYGQAVYDDTSAFTFWRMEDPSGTTLTDLMGSRNGTLVGSFLYHQGSALKSAPTAYSMGFDGSSSRVSIADIPVSGSFTVEGWAYANSWVVGAPIIDRRNTSGDIGGFSLEVADSSGRFNGYIYTSSWQGIQTYRALATGMWHHIVFTYNGQTGGAAIYVNGELQAGTTLGTINNPTTATAAIGFNPSYTIYWPGYLDEIALYARPFSTADVQTHYRLGMASPWAYEAAVESDLAGLVAYWPLDEPTTPNAFDESGRGHTLFEDTGCSYAALSPPGGNNPNNSLFFNNTGQSTAVRSATDSDLLFGSGDFAWEVWVYQDVATAGPILEYGNTTTSDFHIWNYPTGSDLYVNFTPAQWPTGSLEVDGVLTAGVWHHIVVQRAGNTGRVYLDGAQVGSDLDLTGTATQMTTPFNLGFRPLSSGPAAHYGWIDQVAVYNHALSLSTIQNHYQLGTGAAPGGVALTGATVAQAIATGAPRTALAATTVAQSISTAAIRTGLTGLTVTQAISTASPSLRLAATTVAQAGFDELTAAPTLKLAAITVAQAVSTVSLKTLLAAISVGQSVSAAALVIVSDPIHTATSPDTAGLSTTTVGIDTTGKTLLFVGVVNANNTSPFPSYNDAATPLTDSYGNVWTRVGPTAISGFSPWNHFAEAFYCIAPTVGPNHTFTYTATTNTFVGLTVAGTNKV